MTLIEVLVALAVVGLLLSLTIPAVQRSREAARRTTCISNLRQIMMAHHNYVDVYGYFPSTNNGLGGAFLRRIRPFLDRTHDSRQGVSIYACPSDPFATGAYGGSAGYRFSYYTNDGLRRIGSGDGFLGYRSWDPGYGAREINLAPRDIIDGLSTTAAISERAAQPEWFGRSFNWDNFPELWDRQVRLTETRHTELQAIVDECTHRAGRPLVGWVNLHFYNHLMTPNSNSCSNGRPFDWTILFPLTARSDHPQGVNLALADGSVRFVSQSIARDVWWALGTRNGGETVGEF